jgi:hypothetical protein
MFGMRTKNKECFEECRFLLSFFNNTETAEDILSKEKETYYYLPYTEKTSGVQIMDFIRYLKVVCRAAGIQLMFSQPEKGIRILGCVGTDDASDVCYTIPKSIELFGVDSFNYQLDNVLEFYDIYNRYEGKQRYRRNLEALKNNFKYHEALKKAEEKLNEVGQVITKILSRLKYLDTTDISVEMILSDVGIQESYTNLVNDMYLLLDQVETKNTYFKVLSYIINLYQDEVSMKYLIEKDKLFIPLIQNINSILDGLWAMTNRLEDRSDLYNAADAKTKAWMDSLRTFRLWIAAPSPMQ